MPRAIAFHAKRGTVMTVDELIDGCVKIIKTSGEKMTDGECLDAVCDYLQMAKGKPLDCSEVDILDKIDLTWHVEDVLSMPEAVEASLTLEEGRSVLSAVLMKHDCDQGVSWETLRYWIQEVINERS